MSEADHNPWKTLATRVAFENPWLRLEEHDVINPGGGHNCYGKVCFKNLAVGVIPLDEQGNTWLVGQFRYTLGEYSWEIPEGGSPLGEDPVATARRELREETGLSAEIITPLLRIHTSNSVTDEEGFIYVARGLSQGETEFEETEAITVRKLPFDEAVAMVMRGEITDSLSIAGLLKLATLRAGEGAYRGLTRW
ncbi:MAG: NUDIX domain-containing protein [Thiotrichales bacterium]